MIRYLYLKKLVPTLLAPISKILFTIAIFICIDNIDLNLMNLEYEDIKQVVRKVQALLDM